MSSSCRTAPHALRLQVDRQKLVSDTNLLKVDHKLDAFFILLNQVEERLDEQPTAIPLGKINTSGSKGVRNLETLKLPQTSS